MKKILSVYIREVLNEGKSTSSSDSAELPPDSSKMSGSAKDPNGSSKSEKKEEPSLPAGFILEDHYIMTYEHANQIAELFEITDVLKAYKQAPNSYSPSGRGWSIFGMTTYSPVADILGRDLANSQLAKDLVSKYKAYGHAFVLFIDKEGNSARYEFGPAGKEANCPDIPIDNVIKTLVQKFSAEPDLLDNILNTMATTVGASIGGPWAALSASTITAGTIGAIPDIVKIELLEAGLPVLLKSSYGKEILKFMHFNAPGHVWGSENGPTAKMLTGQTVFNMIKQKAESSVKSYAAEGITFSFYEMQDYFIVDVNVQSEKKTYRFKINDVPFDVHDLVPGAATEGMETGAFNDNVVAVVGSSALNLDAGVSYCAGIEALGCDVPYALPAPLVPLPQLVDALNCGLFAANGFNMSSPKFKFNLNVANDQLASPLAFLEQAWPKAPIKVARPG